MFRRAHFSIPILLACVGLAFAKDPDPARVAAAQMGSLLSAPAELPPETDWRDGLAPGDRVEVDGRQVTVTAVEGDFVRIQASGESPQGVGRTEIASLVEKRPLWRYLMDDAPASAGAAGKRELRVRGYRLALTHTNWKDMRLHARAFDSVVRSLRGIAVENGFEFDVVEKSAANFPGLVMLGQFGRDWLSIDFTLPDGTRVGATRPWTPPGRATLLPSLFAICAAILFRRPLLALLCGVLTAGMVHSHYSGSSWPAALWQGPLSAAPRQCLETMGQPSHWVIVGFLVAMLAMVSVARGAGGMSGLMGLISRWARSARSCQVVTYLLGLVVFFDHYANTVLVGTTMRPLSDRFKVAREKLAYIVDSTSAPVAGLSLFSTWIAFEVAAYQPHLADAGMGASQGYEVFLRTLPYRFYSLFTLLLVGLVIASGRDLGPMRRAEQRARAGQVLRAGARLIRPDSPADDPLGSGGAPGRARTAILPIVAFVGVTCACTLVRGGLGESAAFSVSGLRDALYAGSGSVPLLYGACAGLLTAILAAWLAGSGKTIARSAWSGARAASTIVVLLCLAWMFGAQCQRIGTATFLSVMLQEGPNPLLLPVILFLSSALIAFATGSSWSTMTILLPLVVGLAFEAGVNTPVGAEMLVIISIGSVLEGAIFGDHCSPIADSTVMSSIATQSDHVDHVRTQAPYALLAMGTALLCGYVPCVVFGLPPLLCLGTGALALVGALWFSGGKTATPGSLNEPEATELESTAERARAA